MHFLWWIILGWIAGWATGKIMRGSGYGMFVDLLIGIAGAILGATVAVAISGGLRKPNSAEGWETLRDFVPARQI